MRSLSLHSAFLRHRSVTQSVKIPEIFLFTPKKGSNPMAIAESNVNAVTPAALEVHTGGSMFRIPRAKLGRKASEKAALAD